MEGTFFIFLQDYLGYILISLVIVGIIIVVAKSDTKNEENPEDELKKTLAGIRAMGSQSEKKKEYHRYETFHEKNPKNIFERFYSHGVPATRKAEKRARIEQQRVKNRALQEYLRDKK